MTGADGAPASEPEWASWPDERLLDLRLSDLGLTIRQGSELGNRIEQLYGELPAGFTYANSAVVPGDEVLQRGTQEYFLRGGRGSDARPV